MSRTSHPSAIHHVEFKPMKSVPRRGCGRRWYQRRLRSSVASMSSSASGSTRSWSSMLRAPPGLACGACRVRDMRVLLVETGIALPECERVGMGAGLEEGDLQGPLADGVVLAHELVHAAVAKDAVAVRVDVHARRRARRLAVEQEVERDRLLRS